MSIHPRIYLHVLCAWLATQQGKVAAHSLRDRSSPAQSSPVRSSHWLHETPYLQRHRVDANPVRVPPLHQAIYLSVRLCVCASVRTSSAKRH
ncbi:hypothetical protein BC567DRAFT_61124 [Phyllosticta citribraziliensis]